ncbi:MAG: AAA family ATPase [Myxococcota bacterium]
MLTQITLQNFKSFGVRQDVPLRPLTVLVGANNSGKSSFMSVSRFIRNVLHLRQDAFDLEGGAEGLVHRPLAGSGEVVVGWTTASGGYESRSALAREDGQIHQEHERLWHRDAGDAWAVHNGVIGFGGPMSIEPPPRVDEAFNGLGWTSRLLRDGIEKFRPFESVWSPVEHSRIVRLEVAALRKDPHVTDVASELREDGGGLPTTLERWRREAKEPKVTGVHEPAIDRTRLEEFKKFLCAAIPEVIDVVVDLTPDLLHRRLYVVQRDGQKFAAPQVSDGVLAIMAMAAHVFSLPPGGVLFIEEPENHVHPLRLRALVDMLRNAVTTRRCQIVLSTHSPVLLNEFRDEPDAVLLFQRTPEGSRVRPLAEIPELQAELEAVPPGELMQAGFFAEAR